MTEAVFIGGMAMWISMAALMGFGLIGGILLYICERVALKHRDSH